MGSTVNRNPVTGGASARAWPQMAKPRMAANRLRCILVPPSDEAPRLRGVEACCKRLTLARPSHGRLAALVGDKSRRNLSAEAARRLEQHYRPAAAFPGFPHVPTSPGKTGKGDFPVPGASEAIAPPRSTGA